MKNMKKVLTGKCSNCDQMKKENAAMNKAIMETHKNYVEVCNENLELRRRLVACGGL